MPHRGRNVHKKLSHHAAVPTPDEAPDDVQVPTPEVPVPDDVAAAIDQSATRYVSSPPSADGPSGMPAIRTSAPTSTARDTSEPSDSTTATLQHALESDTDMAPSAIRSSTVEDSPSSSIDHHHVSTTSTLYICASCQERPALTSQSTAAEVRAPNQHRPNLRDAATMTEASEDELPGSPMAEQPAHATPVAKADILHADLRSSPRVPPNQGASTGTGALSDPPAEPTPAVFHDIPLPEFLTGDANQQRCTFNAGMLFDTAQASSTAARRAYLPRAVHLITTRTARGVVLQPRRFRVRRLVYPCQHARRNTKLRSALRRHRRHHHYPPTTHDYSTEGMSESLLVFLQHLREFGLVYQRKRRSGRFYPTRLAINLASGLKETTLRSFEAGYIMVETNYRVYAYTNSQLQVALLALFCELLYRFPNLVVARLTRESVRQALRSGITSNQIIKFLRMYAHPEALKQANTRDPSNNHGSTAAVGNGER
ncbi:hypothetical protein HPB52_012221 [Rhipicephalus sanguineus]|uniref:General transcription factor IIH subunit 4 n=1 Tax=Rhipicephalus sanguineus TaxID=34632 RepID=A0A9D4T9U6_RHISA|nr:hypothetical protein HPB52_012221 [Rhipicephalus sanguineus]